MTPILYLLGSLLPIILSLAAANAATNVQTFLYANHSRYEEYSPLQQLYLEDRPDGCPPWFVRGKVYRYAQLIFVASTASFPLLNAINTQTATNLVGNATVPLALAEKIVSNLV